MKTILATLIFLGLSPLLMADPAPQYMHYKLNFKGFYCPAVQRDSIVNDKILPGINRIITGKKAQPTNEIHIDLVIVDESGGAATSTLPNRRKAYKVTAGKRIHLNKTIWRGTPQLLDFQIIAWEMDDPNLSDQLTGLAVDYALTQGRGRVAKSVATSRMGRRAASEVIGQTLEALDISSQISGAIAPITRRVTGADNDLIGAFNLPRLHPYAAARYYHKNGFDYNYTVWMKGNGVRCDFFFEFVPDGPPVGQYPQTNAQTPYPDAPQPSSLWGAAALDSRHKDIHFFNGQPDPDTAAQGALSHCRENSANPNSCKIYVTYDRCAAQATDDYGDLHVISRGDSPESARQQAVADCNAKLKRECQPEWTLCSNGLHQNHELHFTPTEIYTPPSAQPSAPPPAQPSAQRAEPSRDYVFVPLGGVKPKHKDKPGPWSALLVAKFPWGNQPMRIFYSSHLATEETVKQAVQDMCKAKRKEDERHNYFTCKKIFAFKNCAAAVKNFDLSDMAKNVYLSFESTLDKSKQVAMDNCKQTAGNSCHLIWSACNAADEKHYPINNVKVGYFAYVSQDKSKATFKTLSADSTDVWEKASKWCADVHKASCKAVINHVTASCGAYAYDSRHDKFYVENAMDEKQAARKALKECSSHADSQCKVYSTGCAN